MTDDFKMFLVCLGFLVFNSMLCGACVESEQFAMAAFYGFCVVVQVGFIGGALRRFL